VKHCLRFFLILNILIFSNLVNAKGYKHLLEGTVDFYDLKIDFEGPGEASDSDLELTFNYWHLYQPRTYVVGNVVLSEDYKQITGGAAYNLASDQRAAFEFGPGGRFGYAAANLGGGTESGFLLAPYFFTRFFFEGSSTYVGMDFSYVLAFLDDADIRGLDVSFNLGIGF
jgi:hypothetical protein